MATSEHLFLNILRVLKKEKILENFIIIGGWCLLIYRKNFGDPAVISALRTADIDFLIPTNHKFSSRIDIGKAFSELGFEQKFSLNKGYIKYIHPEMEAEFLVPMTGRQVDEPYWIPELRTNAQRLRFLDILVKYSKPAKFHEMTVNVPEPSAFVINKLLTSTRRDNKDKMEKDIKSAKEVGEFILNDSYQKKLLITILTNMEKKQSELYWILQKSIHRNFICIFTKKFLILKNNLYCSLKFNGIISAPGIIEMKCRSRNSG